MKLRKPAIIIGVLMLAASASAAPLTAEIEGLLTGHKVLDKNEAEDLNFEVRETSITREKGFLESFLGAFSSVSGSRDVEFSDSEVLPGERIRLCADVRVESDSLDDGTWLYGHSVYSKFDDLSLEEEKELGTGSPADGSDVRYVIGSYVEACESFDAPSQSGSYKVDFLTTVDRTTYLGSATITVLQDSDGDGEPDKYDEFPNDPDCEEDTDGDGVCDSKDDFPNDPTRTQKQDSDNDGTVDSKDDFPQDPDCVTDSDGDGVCDNLDAFPNDPDCQEDSDNDGVCDNLDAFPQDPTKTDTQDSDGDGIIDSKDPKPDTPGSNQGRPTLDEKVIQYIGKSLIGKILGIENLANYTQS